MRLEKPAHLQRGIGVATDEIDEVPKLHRERLTAVAHERYVDRGVGPIGERLADLLVRTMAVEGDIVSKQVDLNKCRRRGDRNRPHLAVPRSTSRQRGHGARSEPERAIGDFSEAVVARPLLGNDRGYLLVQQVENQIDVVDQQVVDHARSGPGVVG